MDKRNNNISRRAVLKDAAQAGLATALSPLAGFGSATQPAKSSVIIEENKKPGSSDWQLTRVRPHSNGQRTEYIEGFCSRQSVLAGEDIDIMVSTSLQDKFQIEIFRTGYYNGKGARLMKTLGPFEPIEQPTPPIGAKNIHICKWKSTTTLTIPADWVSGVYLGRLTSLPTDITKPYWQSYVIFIVRDERPVDILFQCSDNTWQAYNEWPSNYSLYTHPKGRGPWVDVSFDRPYGRQAQYNSVVNDPLSFGSGEFISLEQPLSYFLEEHGYDVSYCSNSDMITPGRGLKSKVFISVGHDEYWDKRQYYSVEKMRDEGVNLLFLSGNSVSWVTPFSPSEDGRPNRNIYRSGRFGDHTKDYYIRAVQSNGPFPDSGPDEGMLMGVHNKYPINGGGDWIVVNPNHWMFEGTGMKKGDYIPGLVGWEYQGDPSPIPTLEVIAEGYAWVSGKIVSKWESTFYTAPKGNFVFDASTIFWCQALSTPPGHMLPWSHYSRPHGPDVRVQKIMHNLLKKAINK